MIWGRRDNVVRHRMNVLLMGEIRLSDTEVQMVSWYWTQEEVVVLIGE